MKKNATAAMNDMPAETAKMMGRSHCTRKFSISACSGLRGS